MRVEDRTGRSSACTLDSSLARCVWATDSRAFQRQFSVDTYRDAYDAARAVRDVVQESGDGYRRGQDDDGAVVDTIRLTVKPPSVAIRWVSARFWNDVLVLTRIRTEYRLLQPLGQLKSRYATIRATGDYVSSQHDAVGECILTHTVPLTDIRPFPNPLRQHARHPGLPRHPSPPPPRARPVANVGAAHGAREGRKHCVKPRDVSVYAG